MPRVFGIVVVRDAIDLIRINLLHHLGVGLERVLVLDNGSTDGTRERVARLARRLPIELHIDDGPFRQGELVNRLVDEARRQGAEWVLPIDVDEFFTSQAPIPRVLAASGAGALRIRVVNFVQRRSRRWLSERALLTMDHRPARTIPPAEARYHVHAGVWSLVEVEWEPKLVFRPGKRARVTIGAHGLLDPAGPIEGTDEIVCLHAPLRARSRLESRIEHARRVEDAGVPDGPGWQSRDIEPNGFDFDWLWRANSNRRGWLDINGEQRALVPDRRLRDAIAPYAPGRVRSAVSALRLRRTAAH